MVQFFRWVLLLTCGVEISSATHIYEPESVNLRSSEVEEQHFDFFTFAQSWQPAFCHGHFEIAKHNHLYPGCAHPQPFMRTHLTIHGLWPDVFDRKESKVGTTSGDLRHPGFCTHERFEISNIAPFIDDMKLHWPNVKESEKSPTYDEFWEHEWSRHGTCSQLNQSSYFRSTLVLQKQVAPTPPFVQDHVGDIVAIKDLREAFRAWHNSTTGVDVVLKCQKGGAQTFLSQVFACLGKDSKTGGPGTFISCPKTILHEDTCTHVDHVLLLAFPDQMTPYIAIE